MQAVEMFYIWVEKNKYCITKLHCSKSLEMTRGEIKPIC